MEEVAVWDITEKWDNVPSRTTERLGPKKVPNIYKSMKKACDSLPDGREGQANTMLGTGNMPYSWFQASKS